MALHSLESVSACYSCTFPTFRVLMPVCLQIKSWAVNPRLFPAEMSAEAKQLCTGGRPASLASSFPPIVASSLMYAGCAVLCASALPQLLRRVSAPFIVCAAAPLPNPDAATLTPPPVDAEAVKAAVAGWGQRQVDELEAEERLAFACEKAPTEDPVLLKVGGNASLSLRPNEATKHGHVSAVAHLAAA